MTYTVKLRVSNADMSTFTANVLLQGGEEEGSIIPVTHDTDGSDTLVNAEHFFNPYGTVNYAGSTVTFDIGLGCETSFYETYFSITVVGGGTCSIANIDISDIPDGTFIDAIVTSAPTTGVENTNVSKIIAMP